MVTAKPAFNHKRMDGLAILHLYQFQLYKDDRRSISLKSHSKFYTVLLGSEIIPLQVMSD